MSKIKVSLDGENGINVSIGKDKNVDVSLKKPKSASSVAHDINYIPGYVQAERERRANEEVRIANENTRIANEEARIALYNELNEKKDNDYWRGNGVTGTEKTSTAGLTDTYTMTYTDGSTDTFTVTNGAKGDTGEPAQISTVTASVDSNIGTPSVNVSVGGTATDRTFDFAFSNLKGDKGDAGIDATINGVSTLAIEAGENISINQSGSTLTISGAGGVDDYTDLTNKPSINNITLNGNKTLNDLGISPKLSILSYGNSTWNDFINAYNNNSIIYCRASSGTNPASGSQTRLAFMAYVNNATNPTSVEFQYVRSVGTKTESQPIDQVYIYTLTSAGGGTWTVLVRDMAAKVNSGTNTSVSYANGAYTINASQPTVPTKTSDLTNDGSDSTAQYLETDETAYCATSIPYGQVDSTSTATVYTATVPGITELRDGVCMWLKNGIVTSKSGFTININGLGAKPVYNNMAAAGRETTLFNVNYTFFFVYDSTRVAGGCWVLDRGYNSNDNTIGYLLRTNNQSLPMAGALYRYRLVFTSADNEHYVPANTSTSTNATTARTPCQLPINPFGAIFQYNTTTAVAVDVKPAATQLWSQYVMTLGYSFADGEAPSMTISKPVYLKCAPNLDGSAVIDIDEPWVQDLPTTEDGKIYIFLGIATSATQFELMWLHPVYYYKNGAIRLWTNSEDAEQDARLTSIEQQFEGTTVSGEGTSITLNNTMDNGMCSISLKGNTEQSDTPSPTNPVEVSVARGANTIVVENSDASSSNSYSVDLPTETLVNADAYLYGTSNGITTTYSNGYYNISGTASGSWAYIANNVPLNLEAGTYTFSISKALPFRIYIALKNGSTTVRTLTISAGNTYGTDTVSSDVTSYELTITNMTTSQQYNEVVGIQLEKGSAVSPYVPRGSSIELCKIESSQDYIYKDKDKWYLHKEIGKVVLNGTESYTNYNSDGWGDTIAFQTSITNFSATYNVQTSLCDNFAFGTTWGGTAEAFNNANSNVIMRILASRLTGSSQSAFKTWLGTHNVTFYYILSTPTNTEITYQPLIDQLNLLEQATSKENQTIISQTNESSPFYLSAVAYANSITGQLAELKAYVDTKPDSDPYGEYSTTETKVGTFLGKPLYRKTIEHFISDTSALYEMIPTGITNMETLVKSEGTALFDNNIWLPLTFYNDDGFNSYHVSENGQKIVYQRGTGDYPATKFYITLEYTKTTD